VVAGRLPPLELQSEQTHRPLACQAMGIASSACQGPHLFIRLAGSRCRTVRGVPDKPSARWRSRPGVA
jgi:hypothetical protein